MSNEFENTAPKAGAARNAAAGSDSPSCAVVHVEMHPEPVAALSTEERLGELANLFVLEVAINAMTDDPGDIGLLAGLPEAAKTFPFHLELLGLGAERIGPILAEFEFCEVATRTALLAGLYLDATGGNADEISGWATAGMYLASSSSEHVKAGQRWFEENPGERTPLFELVAAYPENFPSLVRYLPVDEKAYLKSVRTQRKRLRLEAVPNDHASQERING